MLSNKIKRPVAGTVLVTFLALVLQPLSVLAQDRPQSAASRRAADAGEEKYSRALNEIHEILKELASPSGKDREMQLRAIGPNVKIEAEPANPRARVDVAKKVSQLREKAKELASLENHVRTGFEDTAQHIRQKNLPPEILGRHEEAVRQFETRAAEFRALLAAVERAAGDEPLQAALNDLGAFMAKYPSQKTHTASDPHKLPWTSPKPVTRAPHASAAQFRTSRLFGEPLRLAQAGSLSGISLPGAALPAAPVPADLAPTEDVQLTQPIRDLAASLGHSPVQIYNWVRNNIQFIPSYGSVQGADMTLRTKRGNSFDTASLLVALLRAANVPARYAYGTIQVPADKAMNWVGGVATPQAAMNLMMQGGIPVTGITQSGRVMAIRLEHVWVEAFVDYVPSRGAVNREPDTWVPLDASFKQYQFTQGMNIRDNVPVDVQGLLNQAQQGATISEAEGWVRNGNQSALQQALTGYESQILAYANAQNPDATVGDALGTQAIVPESRPILLGTLPYARVATGAKFQAMPENLRWKFRYQLYANQVERALDTPFIAYSASTAALAGKKITLSFRPASAADEATIKSFMPAPHADGNPTQPSELPASLPGYLIRLVPELRVEGQLVAAGPAFTMGSELVQNAGYFDPASSQWQDSEDNRPIAGDYIATALDLQGVSAAEGAELVAKVDNAKARLEQAVANGDPTPLQGLTKEDFSGNLLYAGILSYMGAIDVAAQISASTAGVVTIRMPSFGNLGTLLIPRFSLGVVRSVAFAGASMDVDRIVGAAVAKDNDRAKVIAFARAANGQYSALEHQIPEDLFTDKNDPNRPQAFSAVKAIGVASSLGQRVYTLSARNFPNYEAIVAPLALPQDVKAEIVNALAAGKVATFHEGPLSAAGYHGVGYIITDPETGAGAYKISGGASGGDLLTTILVSLVIIGLLALEFIFFLIHFAIAALLLSVLILVLGSVLESKYNVSKLALAAVKVVATTIMMIVVGAAAGAITTIPRLIELTISWVAAIVAALYKSITGIIDAVSRYGPGRVLASGSTTSGARAKA